MLVSLPPHLFCNNIGANFVDDCLFLGVRREARLNLSLCILQERFLASSERVYGVILPLFKLPRLGHGGNIVTTS